MRADEARKLTEQLRVEEEVLRETKNRERIAAQCRETNEEKANRKLQETLLQIKYAVLNRKEPRVTIPELIDIDLSKKKLTLRGWNYDRCLPIYIRQVCARLRELGYSVGITLTKSGNPSPQSGRLYAQIHISW